MRLVIISHTEHYFHENRNICGWGATVREIDYISNLFDEVIHVAPLHSCPPPGSSLFYTSEKVTFIPLLPSGGKGLKAKLGILKVSVSNLSIIISALRKGDIFQFRAPTGLGVYTIPFLTIFNRKKGWFKYAGNWDQKHPPLSYGFQRWWLNNINRRKVTINGYWPNQKKHLLTFENPCLTNAELEEGRKTTIKKEFNKKLNFVFIGNLVDNKGVRRILEAFDLLKTEPKVGTLHLVGDGPLISEYLHLAKSLNIEVIFHGFLPKSEINEILRESHVLLLPSDTEGFPKVVAEGANYGCIPIVSDISCLHQYIHDGENGFLMSSLNTKGLLQSIVQLCSLNPDRLKLISSRVSELGKSFTYEYYCSRIQQEILSK